MESYWRASKYIQTRARQLRREMTPPERRLWSALRGRNLGGHFRRQYPIGNYIADFCCTKAKLIVELDGETHGETTEYDTARTRWIEEHRQYRVLRFTNEQVLKQLDAVAEVIMEALKKRGA